jgi:hypothetical protein
MKTIALTLTILVALFTSRHSSAADADPGVEITADEAAKIVTLDAHDLQGKAPTLVGQIVRLKFACRDSNPGKWEDGLSGTLHGAKVGSKSWATGSLNVRVPASGVEWFLKLPEKAQTPTRVPQASTRFVYVRVPTEWRTLDLIGSDLKTGFGKSPVIGW